MDGVSPHPEITALPLTFSPRESTSTHPAQSPTFLTIAIPTARPQRTTASNVVTSPPITTTLAITTATTVPKAPGIKASTAPASAVHTNRALCSARATSIAPRHLLCGRQIHTAADAALRRLLMLIALLGMPPRDGRTRGR